MSDQKSYKKQLIISCLQLAGGLPSFILLIISYINTRTTIVLMDAIDSGGNVFRNFLVFFISIFLLKDQKFSYNYGVGKIEASSTLVCDLITVLSLGISIILAIGDFISPHSPGDFLIYVVLLKIANVAGDVFMAWREWKLSKKSDSLVFKTKFASEVKNTIFDSVALVALLIMQIFNNAHWTWYVSPVVSLIAGAYLIYQTVDRINESFKIILDKTADEKDQLLIMQTLSAFYDEYDGLIDLRTRYSGGMLFVDLNLGFKRKMTYKQLQDLSDRLYQDLSKKIPKCVVSLIIPAQQPISAVSKPDVE